MTMIFWCCRFFILITAFMISIRAVGTDLLEVRIQIEQLNIDDTGTTTELLQIPVAPEQVATFLGQQIIPHAAPVVIQALTTQHVQHQSVSNKAAAVAASVAVAAVIVGGAAVGSCIGYGFEKAINEDIEFKNSIGNIIGVGIGTVIGLVVVVIIRCVVVK